MAGDDELREAAGRLREHRRVCAAMEHPRNSPYTYVEVSTGAAGFVPEAELKDMAAVVTAWLREHPADDGKSWTPVWLESVGFREGRDGHSIGTGNGSTLTFADGGWYYGWDSEPVVDQPTRGHVRRLLAALGAPPPVG
jgi:hypothetical protein